MRLRLSFQLTAALLAAWLAGTALAEPTWSYDEAEGTGPSQWGNLSSDYHTCANGFSQSPVDLAGATPSGGPALVFKYRPTELVIENNARTVEVVYEPGSTLRVGRDTYRLLQFHFHTPSEHSFAGSRFPMEVHFVHINGAGQLAVVGVLLREGRANPALARILRHAPEDEGEVHVAGRRVDALDLMPRTRRFRSYSGSLTTPPCSEGVRWFVMRRPVEVSAGQIHRLREILEHVQHYPYNARPEQPLNGRSVSIHPQH